MKAIQFKAVLCKVQNKGFKAIQAGLGLQVNQATNLDALVLLYFSYCTFFFEFEACACIIACF